MPSTTLTIDEVYGGGGNSGAYYKNDYIVIHNETNAAFSLANYSVQYSSAAGSTWAATNLSGSIAAGGYYLIQESAGTGGMAALPTPDATGTLALSGTAGKVALVSSTTLLTGAMPSGGSVIDFVGYGSTANAEGSPAPGLDNTHSAVRINNGNTDTDNNATDFSSVLDDATHTPFSSTSAAHAANGGGATSLSIAGVTQAEGNSGTTNFGFVITRSGDTTGSTTVHYASADGTATTADSDYTALSGDLTFAAGDTQKIINVLVNGDTRNEPNETFTVALSAPTGGATFGAGAATATGTITNDDLSVLKIGAVQGADHTSPYANQSVTVAGAVTQVVSNGFYVQDDGDGNDATSDGILVFTSSAPTVQVGQAVMVTGTVSEYAPTTNTDALTVTQLAPATNGIVVTDAATTHVVAPVIIGAGGRLPPTEVIASDNDLATFHPTTDGLDFYESLSGMVVTVKSAQAVDSTYQGSTWVVADNGAEATGLNARGGITISPNDFNPERIQVYKSTSPNYVVGDHLGDVTGVITYYSAGGAQPTPGGNYELLPSSTLPTGGVGGVLARPVTTLQGDATHLAVGAYNVENLDPTDPQARFDLLASDIVTSLKSPDIVSLEEIQDADGPGTGTNYSGMATAQKLIDAITAHGGPHYQYIEIAPTANNQNGGEPNGNIRTGFIYNPDRVTYETGSAQLINDATPGQGTRTGGDAFYNSRHPLLANFQFNGQEITVVGVHNYSRGGSQELFGANQPATNNGDDVRLDQSTELGNFLTDYKTAHQNIVVAGDFNAYYFEPSLQVLSSSSGANLTNLVQTQATTERYSTEYEGNAQQIDNLLVSPSLLNGAQFQTLHVNSGQAVANQASDHDPIVSLLSIPAAAGPTMGGGGGGDTMTAGGGSPPSGSTQIGGAMASTLTGTSNDDSLTAGSSGDTLLGGNGSDTLTSGAGHDQIFGNMGDDHIVVSMASQGAAGYGGQGNDVIDASHSNAPNYLSGDVGNDTILSGAGFETVLGGQGDDSLVGGATAGAGSLQLLFGNQGNDTISYAGAGSVEIFGGQDNDTLSITTSGQGQTHYLFGNLGDDTLTASGGFNSLYGGQGNDVVSAANDQSGHNYLSGDIGNDQIVTSYGGSDTVRGGPGADTITLSYHQGGGADTVLVGAGDSTAQPGAGEISLDHITGFDFSRDKIVVTGHSSGMAANVTTYTDSASSSTEAQAFSAAYTYAYGDSTSAHTAHVGATEYLAVQESYGGISAVYLFTADHTAVVFTGASVSSFQASAIAGG